MSLNIKINTKKNYIKYLINEIIINIKNGGCFKNRFLILKKSL